MKITHPEILVAMTVCLILPFARAESDREEAGVMPFSIEFLKSRVAFQGSVNAKSTADALAAAILTARPELNVVNAGMNFNPEVKMPDLSLLQSLVVEIALSTHEGVFEISDDLLLVGGLTESSLTASVLRLRAEPVLGDRRYREQLCLIPPEDVPEIPILLSTGESRKAFSFDLELKQREAVRFEPPGIILTKILGLIEGTSESTGLYPENVAVNPPANPPLEIGSPAPTGLDRTAEAAVEATLLPPPPSPYREFGPILFARNSFILQSGQREVMDQMAGLLKAEPWAGRPIIVRALTYQSGSEAFATWLSERRMAEAVRQLTAAGIEAGLVKPERVDTMERIDRGEVKILILKPSNFQGPEKPQL